MPSNAAAKLLLSLGAVRGPVEAVLAAADIAVLYAASASIRHVRSRIRHSTALHATRRTLQQWCTYSSECTKSSGECAGVCCASHAHAQLLRPGHVGHEGCGGFRSTQPHHKRAVCVLLC